MSAISQKIPNLFGGISQQPDSKKVPGQVRDLVNGYPEFSLGLIKRPGGQFQHDLTGVEISESTPSGRWFSILSGPNEKYAVQFYKTNSGGPRLNIWDILNGREIFVSYENILDDSPEIYDSIISEDDNGNLTGSWKDYDNHVYDNNDVNSVIKRQSDYIDGLATTQQNINKSQDKVLAHFKLKSTYDPSDINNILYDGVLVGQNGSLSFNRNGQSFTDEIPENLQQGTNERTADVPQLARLGFRVFEIIDTTPGQEGLDTNHNAFDDNYKGIRHERMRPAAEGQDHNDYRAYVEDNDDYKDAVNISGSYLDADDLNNLEFLTDNQVTYILNKEKIVKYKTDDNGVPLPSDDGLSGSYLVEIRVHDPSENYKLKVFYTKPDGTTDDAGSDSYSAATVDSFYDTIINDSPTAETFLNHSDHTSYISVTRFNNTFLIKPVGDTTITNVEVQGPGLDYIVATNVEVDDVSKLPSSCFHGKKVKVINTAESNLDDMWVRYELANYNSDTANGTPGEGAWVETVAPGIKYQLDPDTLPHQLVRNANGYFEVKPIVWEDRRVGDLETNPDPSFIGSNINGMFFYRNRFGFLSGANVIMSRANKLYDFFNKSALAVGDDDPVDVTAVSTQPVALSYVTQTSVGLLIFGTTEQFLLTVGNDILSPSTANINSIARYSVDTRLESQSLGTSTIFFSKTRNYLSSFEFINISNTQAPSSIEHTSFVPELLPSSIDKVVSSPSKSIISFGQTATKTLYQYRFLRIGEKELATAWYKWELPGKLVDQFFDDTVLYCIVSDNTGRCFAISFDLNQSNANGYLKATDEFKFDPCLDMWTLNPPAEYDSDNQVTKYYLPYQDQFDTSIYGILLDTAGNKQLHSLSPTIFAESDEVTVNSVPIQTFVNITDSEGNTQSIDSDDTTQNAVVRIAGDTRGRDIIFGVKYTMTVELPTIFLQSGSGSETRTDTDSNLIIKKLNVLTGPSGPISFRVEYTGVDAQVSTQSVNLSYEAEADSTFTLVNTEANIYKLNTLNVSLADSRSVPVYQRNTNVTITAIGDSPLPVNILSIAWEGRATSKFYRRG